MTRQWNALALPPLDADEVDQRLADGWSLPSTLYLDPAVAELEHEVVFKNGWHIIGTTADFRKRGDFLTTLLANRYPVMVARGSDGELRGFLNICRHRGCLVQGGPTGDNPDLGSGNARRFTCPYHAWTYNLEGALVGVPEQHGGNLPPKEELGLHPISVGVWKGIVFVSIAPDETLAQTLSELDGAAEVNNYDDPFSDDELVFAGSYSFEVNANWKLYVENNIECYHCLTAHKDTLGAICTVKVDDFSVMTFKNGFYLAADFTDRLESAVGDADAERMREISDSTGVRPMQQYWVWPGNLFSTGVVFGKAVFRIDPISAGKCRMIGRAYARPDETDEMLLRLQEYMGSIVDEDTGISQGAQWGLGAGLQEYGPLLAKREMGIQWAAENVWQRLAPAFRD